MLVCLHMLMSLGRLKFKTLTLSFFKNQTRFFFCQLTLLDSLSLTL